jgi:hypothetical protein
MAELFGKKTGCCRGQGGSMHMFSAKHNVLGGYAFIGEGIPIGLGAAFQSAYKCVCVPLRASGWAARVRGSVPRQPGAARAGSSSSTRHARGSLQAFRAPRC